MNRGPMAGVPERARALVREQLAHGPRPEAHVLAAADTASIPQRSVIITADAAASALLSWQPPLPVPGAGGVPRGRPR